MAANQPISMDHLAAEVRDLKLAIAGLSAVLGAIPQTAEVDAELVRQLLEAIIDPKGDQVPGDQMARAMHFAQATLRLARAS